MAWENIVYGYKIMAFGRDGTVPIGSIFMCSERVTIEQPSMVSRGYYETAYYFQVPVYKKKNIKKK